MSSFYLILALLQQHTVFNKKLPHAVINLIVYEQLKIH